MIPTIETLELLKALPLSKEGDTFFVTSEECVYKYNGEEWVKEEEQKVVIGSLYDLNKQVIFQLPNLTPEKIMSGLDLIEDFVNKTNNTYYMLLNHDLHYYTIFMRCDTEEDRLAQATYECLSSLRCTYKSIDYTADGDAVEIWLHNEEIGAIMFLLFPYDQGVVLCK